jgi:hypothetical protein
MIECTQTFCYFEGNMVQFIAYPFQGKNIGMHP